MIFQTGQTVMTCGIESRIDEIPSFRSEIMRSLNRYTKGDWGEVSEDSKKLNDEAVKTCEDRILAAYPTSQDKIWIITDWEYGEKHTTVLFPHEY